MNPYDNPFLPDDRGLSRIMANLDIPGKVLRRKYLHIRKDSEEYQELSLAGIQGLEEANRTYQPGKKSFRTHVWQYVQYRMQDCWRRLEREQQEKAKFKPYESWDVDPFQLDRRSEGDLNRSRRELAEVIGFQIGLMLEILDPHYREILWLYYWREYSPKKIGDKIGVPYQRVTADHKKALLVAKPILIDLLDKAGLLDQTLKHLTLTRKEIEMEDKIFKSISLPYRKKKRASADGEEEEA